MSALYQRAKGRDVFDLWLALTALGVDPRAIAEAFTPYQPENWPAAKAEQNLREKLTKHAYRDDLRQLVRTPPTGFDLADAIETLLHQLITQIDA